MKDDDVIDGRWRVQGERDYSGPPRQETWADFWRWIGRIVGIAWSFGVVMLVSSCSHAVIDAVWPK